MLLLLLVLAAAWSAGLLATRLGYPAMLGELLVGILLGPPLLGWIPMDPELVPLSELGIFLMMLYIGTEIDPGEMLKSSKAALLAAVGGFLVPFVLGFAFTYFYMAETLPADVDDRQWKMVAAGLFCGMSIAVTSLAAKSRILLDLKLLDTRIALVLMAGALLSDTGALVIFAMITGFAETRQFDALQLLIVFSKAVGFFVLSSSIGYLLFPHLERILKQLRANNMTSRIMLMIVLALGFGELAHLMGLHSILGAFMAGLFVRRWVRDRREYAEVTHRLHAVSIGLLAPIFFVTAGFAFDFKVFSSDLWLLIGVVSLAIIGKIAGTMLFYLPSGHSWREGLAIGFGMNGRGAVEIIIAGIGLQQGLINEALYSALVFMAIFTTAMVPVTLKWSTEWLRKRGELAKVNQRTGYLIIGAGPLARKLAKQLATSHTVSLVDRNHDNVRAAVRAGMHAVHGNVMQEATLEEANALQFQTVITMTPNSEVNLMAARFARDHFLIPEQVVLLAGSSGKDYSHILAAEGIGLLFGKPISLADWDRWIVRERVEMQTVERFETNDHTLAILEHNQQDELKLYDASSEATHPVVLRRTEEERIESDHFDAQVEEAIVIDLQEAMSRDAFISLAAQRLAPVLSMDASKILDALQSRELESATVVGNGLAIPHFKIGGTGINHLLIARCRKGVDFGEDGSVHAIFVLVNSIDQRNYHLRSLSAIAQIVQNTDFESRWFEAENEPALRTLVRTAKRRRT